MKVAVITITKEGKETGKRILEVLKEHDTVLYVSRRFADKKSRAINNLKEFVGRVFNTYDALVFVMALGIVVRVISKQDMRKGRDPAVVVVDEKGRHAVSVLSGHYGANELARVIASGIGAEPVITTTMHVQRKPSVEALAKKFGFEIENFGQVKAVNAAIVNRERVKIFSDIKLDINLPENMSVHGLSDLTSGEGGIIITSREIGNSKHVILRPRNLVVGVGARRGVERERVLSAVRHTLRRARLSILSIKAIATVDFKAGEKGIVEVAEELGIPVMQVEPEKIREFKHLFRQSHFVLNKVGVGAVCEPAAVLAGKDARLIQKKVKFNGVTVAVAEERWS